MNVTFFRVFVLWSYHFVLVLTKKIENVVQVRVDNSNGTGVQKIGLRDLCALNCLFFLYLGGNIIH